MSLFFNAFRILQGRLNKIASAYCKSKIYLDRNFLNELVKKEKYDSRLWELWICSKLLETGSLQKHQGDGMPDFILKGASEIEPDLIFECICPQPNEENSHTSGTYERKEEKGPHKITTATESGIDNYTVEKFLGVFKEKSKEIMQYKANHRNSGNSDVKGILCVSGYSLSKFKAQERGSTLPTLSMQADFENALFGERRDFFIKNQSGLHSEFHSSTITKKNKTSLCVPNKEFLKEYAHYTTVL